MSLHTEMERANRLAAHLAEAEEMLDRANHTIQRMVADNATAGKYETLRQEMDELNQTLNEQKALIQVLERDLTGYRATISRQNKDIMAYKQEAQTLKAENKRLGEQVAELLTQRLNQNKRLSGLSPEAAVQAMTPQSEPEKKVEEPPKPFSLLEIE